MDVLIIFSEKGIDLAKIKVIQILENLKNKIQQINILLNKMGILISNIE